MKKRILLFLSVMMSVVFGCTDLDDVNNRLDNLEMTVSNLQSALDALQQAYDDGKLISSVTPVEGMDGAWVITFSDATSIRLTSGADGKDGRDGVDGKDGADGKDGRDGVDGKDGADGKDGRDGVDGKDGTDGKDGNDGITPYLLIDTDGYWCVSYDNGVTFSRLLDSNGNPIKAEGEKGEKGDKGEDGENGISVRIVVDENGFYVFQLYRTSDPDTIIETITTPIDSNPDHLISSIVEDDVTHVITITMQNGKSYTFNMIWNTPTSIAVLTNRIRLTEGSTASFEFRVNPSNACFNYDLDSDDCEIELDFVGAATRSFSSYVTAPTNYKLTKVEQVYTEEGVLKAGQYRAYITDLAINKSYDELVALVVTVVNGAGEKVQISSSAIEVVCSPAITEFKLLSSVNKDIVTKDIEAVIDGSNITFVTDPSTVLNTSNLIVSFATNGGKVFVGNTEQHSGISAQDFTSPVKYTIVSDEGKTSTYTVTVNVSGMPYVYIDTPGGVAITSKVDWTKDCSIAIVRADGQSDYADTKLQMRGRGNSTWTYPKKPYALKLDAKSEILGMPKHKRWVLLANWMDRTMLRNDVTFEIARQTGLEWTPRGQFVEVVLNGKHVGCYYLCEQIKIDKNRVNITEMSEKDTDGEAVTGGYLVELDVNFDEVNKFKSALRDLPYQFKDPDEDVLQPQQFSYFQNYINAMEEAMYSDNWLNKREYADYMDLETFVDWWFVHELSMNGEPNWPKSSYMYKDRNGKLKAGPVWDFDWATFVPNKTSSYTVKNAIYYNRLFLDPEFVSLVKTRWTAQKPKFETIPDYIQKVAAQTKAANDINIKLWPITTTTNGDEKMTFDEAINRMIEAYKAKLNWLDSQITNM